MTLVTEGILHVQTRYFSEFIAIKESRMRPGALLATGTTILSGPKNSLAIKILRELYKEPCSVKSNFVYSDNGHILW